MANPFLSTEDHSELEVAILYDKAKVTDARNTPAYTDGDTIFLNTDENLARLLPAYDEHYTKKMLLLHEAEHIELKHHARYYKYLEERNNTPDKFNLNHDEVNIIMDILVHDIILERYPDIIETTIQNCGQLRDRNQLMYTFKTHTLEEMLDEYSEYKKQSQQEDEQQEEDTGDGDNKDTGDGNNNNNNEGENKKQPSNTGDDKEKQPSGANSSESEEDQENNNTTPPNSEQAPGESHHDETDWSQLHAIDTREFIREDEAEEIEKHIDELRNKKIKMGRLTKTLNSLATTKRERTYRLPSMLQTNDGCIFKGKTPGRTALYLVFDASGSMSGEMRLFKDIITRSIPHALKCPCEWFAGYGSPIEPYKTDGYCDDGYYKGTFKDFLPTCASHGFSDDGDRTIELCYQAEQKGFSPIGVTDGGGGIYSCKAEKQLKQLKKTILVCPCNGWTKDWIKTVKEINPSIQILEV